MFKIKTKLIKGCINVDDDFALLTNDKDGILFFEFLYSIKKELFVELKSTSVRISVYTTKPSLKFEISKYNEVKTTSESSINNYLKTHSKIMDASNSFKLPIAEKKSDPTTKIDNQFMQNQKLGIKETQNQLVMITVSEIKKTNETVLIPGGKLSFSLSSDKQEFESNEASVKSIMHKIMTEEKKDPVSLSTYKQTSLSSVAALDKFPQSMILKSDSSYSSSEKFHNLVTKTTSKNSNLVEDSSNDEIVFIKKTVPVTSSTIVTSMSFNESKLFLNNSKVGTVYVKFELLDSNLNILEVVEKTLDTATHIKNYREPRIPPTVSVSYSGPTFSRATLKIKQLDQKSSKIRVYKKLVSNVPDQNQKFIFVGEYYVVRDREISINVPRPLHGLQLYRFVSLSENNTLSSFFASCVIHAKDQKSHLIQPSLTATQKQNGIEILISNFSDDVVVIRVNRRDTTIKEKHYQIQSESIYVNNSESLLWSDINVTYDHVYEYNVTLVYRNGDHVTTGYAVSEYFDRNKLGYVDISIENFQLNGTQPSFTINNTVSAPSQENLNEMNVTFDIQARVLDGFNDNLKNLLEFYGISNLYEQEIKDEKDFLKKLLSFHIKRVNVTTGHVDDFGVITDVVFNEKLYRNNKQIDPLEKGYVYQYIVTPILSSTNTLFSTSLKTVTDSITKKSYSFAPSKFYHPYALKTGTLTSKITEKLLHAKDTMEFGKLGVNAIKELSLENFSVSILNFEARKFSRNTILLTWSITGDNSYVDSFLIVREIRGSREIIGKVHSFFNMNYSYFYNYTSTDFGSTKFIIVPVLNNFSFGNELTSQTIILN